MRRRNNTGFIWFLFILMMFGGFDLLGPLVAIFAAVAGITIASVMMNRKNNSSTYSSGNKYENTYGYTTTSSSAFSASEMARVNVYLRTWYKNHRSLPIGRNIDLRIKGDSYKSMQSLDVYRNNTYICSLTDFKRRYPDSYEEIMSELLSLAKNPQSTEVFDAEVDTGTSTQTVQEEVKEEKKEEKKGAQYFIDQINSLNDDIPDEEISNGLYETCSLLKQIQALELKFPDSKEKLKKLYDYYLPILVRILVQYENLQDVKSDPSYEETRSRLTRTIDLINDAMTTIISTISDQDFINLSADISTLEAVLQKDGLTSDGRIEAQKKGGE